MVPKEELVSVALIREDLRQVLVAAQMWLEHWREEGASGKRLELAISRLESTATSAEWQPKDPDLGTRLVACTGQG